MITINKFKGKVIESAELPFGSAVGVEVGVKAVGVGVVGDVGLGEVDVSDMVIVCVLLQSLATTIIIGRLLGSTPPKGELYIILLFG